MKTNTRPQVAVIGSRDLSDDERQMLVQTAMWLARRSVRGRSGGAKGADDAWEEGWARVDASLFTVCAPDGRSRRDGVHVVRPPYPDWTQALARAEWEFGSRLPKVGLPPYSEPELQDVFEQASSWKWISGARPFVAGLMVRNAAIICPSEHQTVDMVLGMLSRKKGGGGTGHGFRLAQALGVPTFDLRNPVEREMARSALEKLPVQSRRGRGR